MIDFTIDEKLLSMRMISDASLATSVPEMPIEKPTLAVLSAGPSFVPSLVTLTISRIILRVSTRIFWSSGEERAKTSSRSRGTMAIILDWESWRKFMIILPGVKLTHCVAMERAVRTLSPVHILKVTPARWHLMTAWRTSRRGSSIPAMPMRIEFCERSSKRT